MGKVCVSAFKSWLGNAQDEEHRELDPRMLGIPEEAVRLALLDDQAASEFHTPTTEHGDELLPAGGRANKENGG
ncbi:hypothetical protein FJ950_28570 [Mesorhizobium sp. B2-3-14]|uniref:hypothetical protein n=1 Tax=unclassified Mesorhizobium TaxID=325217 RepID=UPI00112AA55A|nr:MULTISPECIES: hypothetical protein [unclassified Mesorhizobium]MBZ9932915.1 hypothetical protein [Mesorhizobium sp. BR1-1-5]MBZ9905574.1 hypothetical protein [Mesorhizobium sp. BR115XR7A]TPK73826.1 hypothetical protein FJ527_21955 [Mesorhizobium sp. B2-4-18]TPL74152.1 hypothetical protein FJ954_10525 [Mesorhizobium sp. B2-3-15]TPL79355.1 hypothetical protein FJ950_28570 [Mesorhizobium sp. B2-3-14]